jgi:plastocyanin
MKTMRVNTSNATKSRSWAIAGMLSVLMSCTVAAYAAPVVKTTPTTTAASAPAPTGTEVKIDNFAFNPAVITVKAGTQVIWINKDDIPHTVDSSEGKFKSSALDTDDKFEFKFSEPGEYPFFCRMHPKMTGKVIVQP